MPHAIGIDLGTVYSCVGVYRNGSVEIIANDQGNRVSPSIVAYTESGRLVGDAAKNLLNQNVQNTIFGAKRVIGQRFGSIPANDLERWPFEIVNDEGNPKYRVIVGNKVEMLSPEMISAEVLRGLKRTAENLLNEVVTHAVITVPAHFNDSQRQATKDAAEIVGLHVLQLLSEPTAASVAYGLNKPLQTEQNILVFDMGGGTFDVSILIIDNGPDNGVFQVKANGSDLHLGGEDFNNKMLDHFLQEIDETYDVDLKRDKVAISQLLKECELAKIALSSSSVANIKIPSLFNDVDFISSITRARFEELNTSFFNKAIQIVEQTIKDAKLTKAEIEEVVLVGGSSYIPMVQKMLQDCFGGKKLNKSIRPDEAVAYGAAMLASILHGGEESDLNLVLLDVTPMSLGVEHGGLMFHKLIERNTTIPTKVTSSIFSTGRDNQTSVEIKVYQGERSYARENTFLGRFTLENLPEAKALMLRILVTFEIDSDGILKVQARETSSGASNMISVDTFKDGLGLSVQEKIREARKFAAEDRLRIRQFMRQRQMKPVKEKLSVVLNFKHGTDEFNLGNFDKAYKYLTDVINIHENNVEAIRMRACIQFECEQYEECIIECEELLKLREIAEIKILMNDAKTKLSGEKAWYEVVNIDKRSSKEDFGRAYRKLAAEVSPNAGKNARLNKIDKRKMEAKMARLNKAKADFEKSK